MTSNMSAIDRIIRLVIVVIIAALYFTGQISGIALIVLGIIAVAFLLTGIISWCPIYAVLGLSTKKKE
jgi:hypothetical protein